MKYDYTKKLYRIFLTGIYDGCDFQQIFSRERSFGVKKHELDIALYQLLRENNVEKRGEKFYVNAVKKREKDEKDRENAVTLVGVIRTNERGFGFLTVSGDKDYYVSPENLGDALNGDKVEAFAVEGRKTNDSARVVKILERGKDSVVGTFFTEGALSYVRPDDKNYLSDIFIPDGFTGGAKKGEKVFVRILKFVKMRCPEGKIEAVIGSPACFETEENAIIFNYGLNEDFSADALSAARAFKQKVDDNALIDRLNLENETIFTIDGDSAKDFDDAVSIEKTDAGYLLGVHIADVSEYVKTGGAIDKCALKRATSVYFPDRVIPMLPFELADGLCSLVEGETRLTLSVFCEIDKGGNVLTTDFKKSFIKSKKRLTYNEVDRLFNGDESLRADLGEIAEKLFLMRDLSKLLKSRRREQGYIDLDVKESDVTVSDGEIKVSLHESTAATELIEQFMITANEAVANLLFYQNIPCIYRVHEKPTNEKLLSLKAFAAALGVKLNLRKDECYPKDIQKFLIAAGDKETQALVNKTVLRCMAKAKYSTQNLGHFGLASKCYCHFTSPIRRYPDLNVHRVLKSVLDGEIMEKIDLYADFFIKAAEISSQKERNAEEAERAMDDLYKAAYLSKRVGEEFVGVISGVTSGGAFVALPNGCEVFCPIDLFPNGQYEFDKDAFSIKSARFDFRVGKSVGVKILGADLSERKAHAAFTDLRSVRRVKAKK